MRSGTGGWGGNRIAMDTIASVRVGSDTCVDNIKKQNSPARFLRNLEMHRKIVIQLATLTAKGASTCCKASASTKG